MPCKTAKSFGPCTINNYTEEDIEWLKRLECTVMTCSEEIGKEGTPHLQFHVTFRRSYSLAALKKLHNEAHWEFQECRQDNNYVRKRDSKLIIDRDERKPKGARTDIEDVKRIVQETNSMREVIKVATSYQAVRMAELCLKYNEPKRPINPNIEVHYRWGAADQGKTRRVWEKHGIDDVFTPTTYTWWEGYDAHKIVLIDEFRSDWCTYRQILKLTDIYPDRVQCKNGSRQLHATTFYITSCYPPEEIYPDYTLGPRDSVNQFLRRLTTVTHVGVDVDPLQAEPAT